MKLSIVLVALFVGLAASMTNFKSPRLQNRAEVQAPYKRDYVYRRMLPPNYLRPYPHPRPHPFVEPFSLDRLEGLLRDALIQVRLMQNIVYGAPHVGPPHGATGAGSGSGSGAGSASNPGFDGGNGSGSGSGAGPAGSPGSNGGSGSGSGSGAGPAGSPPFNAGNGSGSGSGAGAQETSTPPNEQGSGSGSGSGSGEGTTLPPASKRAFERLRFLIRELQLDNKY